MTCDNAVTKPHIGRVLSFSQQLKFRGAFSVQPHAHKTVQYGHGTSRQNADKYDNEFYVKNRQSALTFPTFLHKYPHNQRIALSLRRSPALGEGQRTPKVSANRNKIHIGALLRLPNRASVGGHPLPVRQPRLPPKKAERGGREQSRWPPVARACRRLCLFEPPSLMPARRFPPPLTLNPLF